MPIPLFQRQPLSPENSHVFLLVQKRKNWKRILALLSCAPTLSLIFYFVILWFSLPDIADPRELIASQSTAITDRNGVELYRLFQEEDRTYLPPESIPLVAKQALIAIEDERFYEHGCFDARAIFRAILANITTFKSQGGSTITQQLARNALLTREKRISRKVKELMLACLLEQRYTKEEIINLYLNWIPFGQNAYGIEQASQKYFGIPAKSLSLAQAAVLAALPQRPSYFSPYGKHLHTEVSEKAKDDIQKGTITRTSRIPESEIFIGLLGQSIGTGSLSLYVGGRNDQVLKNMQRVGFISEQERLAALDEAEHLTFQPSRENIRAPHFVLWIRQQVAELFNEGDEVNLLEQGGLTVETTIDWEVQQIAEEAIDNRHRDIVSLYGAQNVALVALDVETGEILAYVGNADYTDETHGGKVDMARIPRQPGSSFKPITYAAAFEHGATPATMLYDVPIKIGEDEPRNFDGKFWGPMTIRRALGASRNIPATQAFFLAGGEGAILQLAKRLGAPTALQKKEESKKSGSGAFEYGWPLSIGAAEVSLLEMVHAYSTLADGGMFKPIVSIRRITDKHGNILFQGTPQEGEEVLDPRIAYQITSILSDGEARPEGFWRNQLTIPGLEVAAKTGTSNKCLERDEKEKCMLRKPDNAWIIGYSPELAVGVWAGNADSSAMYEKGDGLNTSSPIWREFMIRASGKLHDPQKTFNVPDDLAHVQISTLSGELPTDCTPIEFRKTDTFLKEHLPSKPDPACVRATIDRLTHLLSSESCPEEAQEQRSFFVPSPLLADRFPEWEASLQEWMEEHERLWYATETHSGSLLPLPPLPREVCNLSLTPGRGERPIITITFPKDGGHVPFPSFRPSFEYTVGSRVQGIAFSVDGKKLLEGTGALLYPLLRMPRSIQKEGLHTLIITLTDQYFNEAHHEVRFSFEEDKHPPVITFLSPNEKTQKQGESLILRVEAIDGEGEIKYVQFYLNEILLSTRPKSPYELTYLLDVEPGVYVLRAVAVDLAGNKTETTRPLIVTQ